MAVDDPETIDILGTESTTGQVVLTISDHLDWSDTIAHQLLLQDKMNRYLSFAESGEILEHAPHARNKPVVIRVIGKYEPDDEGRRFFDRVRLILEEAGFEFRFQLFERLGPQ